MQIVSHSVHNNELKSSILLYIWLSLATAGKLLENTTFTKEATKYMQLRVLEKVIIDVDLI